MTAGRSRCGHSLGTAGGGPGLANLWASASSSCSGQLPAWREALCGWELRCWSPPHPERGPCAPARHLQRRAAGGPVGSQAVPSQCCVQALCHWPTRGPFPRVGPSVWPQRQVLQEELSGLRNDCPLPLHASTVQQCLLGGEEEEIRGSECAGSIRRRWGWPGLSDSRQRRKCCVNFPGMSLSWCEDSPGSSESSRLSPRAACRWDRQKLQLWSSSRPYLSSWAPSGASTQARRSRSSEVAGFSRGLASNKQSCRRRAVVCTVCSQPPSPTQGTVV